MTTGAGVDDVLRLFRNGATLPSFIVVGGNVADTFQRGMGADHPDFLTFFMEVAKARFPNLAVYDQLNGWSIAKGEDLCRVLVPGAAKETPAAGAKKLSPIQQQVQNIAASKAGASDDLANDKPPSPIEAVRKALRIIRAARGGRCPAKGDTLFVFNHADLSFGGEHAAEEIRVAIREMAALAKNGSGGASFTIMLIGPYAHELGQHLPKPTSAIVLRLGKPGMTRREIFAGKLGMPSGLDAVFARAAAGLGLKDMARIVEDLGELTEEALLQEVFQAKCAVAEAECGGMLMPIRSRFGFEAIGGMDTLVAEFRRFVESMRIGRTAAVPMGILLLGPPGTGKTLFATALAKEAGLTCWELGDIKSKWVGESESRQRRVFDFLRDVGGILFVDEADMILGRRDGAGGDSGVSENLRQQQLKFFGDPALRGHVLTVFASNRSDRIDFALLRSGRVDLIVPIVRPDVNRLKAIFERAPHQLGISHLVEDWRPFAESESCRGYTGSDVTEVVRQAWSAALSEGRDTLTETDLWTAIEDYTPDIGNEAQHALAELLALRVCKNKRLLPPDLDDRMAGLLATLESKGVSVPALM
jgi:DNA polymerase III delta prime subunit